MATALGSVVGVLLWLMALVGGWGAYQPAGGWLLWHAHLLVVGIALASVMGFLLTAVPEFTGCAPLPSNALQRMFAVWLLARGAHLASGLWPVGLVVMMALADAWLSWRLLAFAAPPIWRAPQRRHVAFIPALLTLSLVNLGAALSLWAEDGRTLEWIHASAHVLMTLIVVALSRVSMRMVNDALQAQGHLDANYLARPPRRNLAVFCIATYAAVSFAWPHASTSGWLALATAAAVFNLLNDWHVRTALTSRWVWPLYAVYAFMGAGYIMLGCAQLWGLAGTNLGHHLLLVGALGMSQWMVMVIASSLHSGHRLPVGFWVPMGAALLVISAITRASATWPAWVGGAMHGWTLSALAWTVAWTLYLRYSWHTLWHVRPDELQGCEEGSAGSCDTRTHD